MTVRKNALMGKRIVVAALTVAALAAPCALAGCGGETPADTDEAPVEQEAEPEQAEPEASDAEYAVTIDGSAMTEDYEGNPAMIVDFTFTNNSDEATSFAVACSQKAFQNGVELERAITTDDLGNGYMAEIKPGATTTARIAYALTDESDVTVEVEELFSFDDTMLAEATFSVA